MRGIPSSSCTVGGIPGSSRSMASTSASCVNCCSRLTSIIRSSSRLSGVPGSSRGMTSCVHRNVCCRSTAAGIKCRNSRRKYSRL